MLEDPKLSREVLSRLDAMGISLSVDDFGTGYSSLAQLRRLPVVRAQDRPRLRGSMQSDDRDAFIVRSSIQLGQNLGLKIVAEGVEDTRRSSRCAAWAATSSRATRSCGPCRPAS